MKTFCVSRCVMCVVLITSVSYLSGCASIASKSVYQVQLSSEPPGADVTITDDTGFVVFEVKTQGDGMRVSVPLKASKGFFAKTTYTVTFEKEGYIRHDRVLEATLDGWYFGNFFIPVAGWLSLVIIDPATGAMWKLDERVHGILKQKEMSSLGACGLHILLLEDIPKETREHLVKIE